MRCAGYGGCTHQCGCQGRCDKCFDTKINRLVDIAMDFASGDFGVDRLRERIIEVED